MIVSDVSDICRCAALAALDNSFSRRKLWFTAVGDANKPVH
jgi:hypothetical protein